MVAGRTRHAEETAAAAAKTAAKAALTNRAAAAATPSARPPVAHHVSYATQVAKLKGRLGNSRRDVKVARLQRDEVISDRDRRVTAAHAAAEARLERFRATLTDVRKRATQSW